MAGTARETREDTWDLEVEPIPCVPLDEARAHDDFWREAHARENYFRRGLDYEDYAPAYCVGYIGHAQYGGDFDEAEKSLLSNWVRIKGDSRLPLDEARLAMRAAWERCEALQRAGAPATAGQGAEAFEFAQALRGQLERWVQAAGAWLGQRPAPAIHQRAAHGGYGRR